MMNFTFDEATHTYQMENGEIWPSVTQVLQDMGFVDSRWFTEESRTRGKYVHKIIELHVKGELDEDTVDESLKGYFEAYQRFACDTSFIPEEIEVPASILTYRFTGTPDYVGLLNGLPSIIDGKSGLISAVTGLQLAGYEVLKQGRYKRFALQLKADGNYKLTSFTDRNDRAIFLQAVSLWWWQKNNH